MERRYTRFHWRERTERINWRMLHRLHLPELVQRGDPMELEPYILHLTFAKLPNASNGKKMNPEDYDAWHIVRIFQLAMEYFMFLRSQDRIIVDTLQQQVTWCEKEYESLCQRTAQWKKQYKICEKQLEYVQSVLYTIGTVLQVQGVTPSVMKTIEKALQDVDMYEKKHLKKANIGKDMGNSPELEGYEACLCNSCGKLFSSREYLNLHVARRHNQEYSNEKINHIQGRRIYGRDLSTTSQVMNKELNNVQNDNVNHIWETLEKSFEQHRECLKSVANDEAIKIQSLFGDLKERSQIFDDMRAEKENLTMQMNEVKKEFQDYCMKRDIVKNELEDLHEKLSFEREKRAINKEDQISSTISGLQNNVDDFAAAIEIKRLEQMLVTSNAVLQKTREELDYLQSNYNKVLQRNETLDLNLLNSENHVIALKSSLDNRLISDNAKKYSEIHTQTSLDGKIDMSVQTNSCIVKEEIFLHDSETQTNPSLVKEEILHHDSGTQTDEEVKDHISTVARNILTELIQQAITIGRSLDKVPTELSSNIPNKDKLDDGHQTASRIEQGINTDSEIPVKVDIAINTVPNEEISRHVNDMHAQRLMEKIVSKAQQSSTKLLNKNSAQDFPCNPLRHRPFLTNRYNHNENNIESRISEKAHTLAAQMNQLGVNPTKQHLSAKEYGIAETALHSRMKEKDAHVLGHMIKVSHQVDKIVDQHWDAELKKNSQVIIKYS